MTAKQGEFLREFQLLSVTAEVPVGQEKEIYTAVDLDGEYDGTGGARGIVANSREGHLTIAVLGQIPAKIADGVTFTKGAPLKSTATGELTPAITGESYVALALEGVTAADNDFAEVFVSPVVIL